MPVARYFVERLTAHSDAWMVKFDDEEHGPYESQSEAVLFAIDAAEKLNEHGEKAQRLCIRQICAIRIILDPILSVYRKEISRHRTPNTLRLHSPWWADENGS